MTTGKTTSTEYGDDILSEALTDEIMEEQRPNMVVARHINYYSNAGTRSATKKLRRWRNPGRASSASQGVRFTELTQFGMDALSVSPSEFAVMIGLVTNDAVELRTGRETVGELFNRGTFEEQFAALSPEVKLIAGSLFETLEYESAAMFAGFSRSVGATGVAFSVDDFDDALAELESEDLPHDDIVACLDKSQHSTLRKEIAVTSGGFAGAIWDSDLASIVQHRLNMTKDGLKGALLGVPTFAIGAGVRQLVNADADVLGGMFLRGVGAPEDGGGGQPGAIAFVEGRRIVWTFEGDHRERGAEAQGNWKGAHAEREDLWGVKLLSVAPA